MMPYQGSPHLHKLRSLATDVAVSMMGRVRTALAGGQLLTTSPQVAIGRTYSYMPAVLKPVAVRKFAAHLKTLP